MNLQYLEGVPGWELKEDSISFRKSDEIPEEFARTYEKLLKNDITSFVISEKHSICFYPFLEELGRHGDVKIVKGQVVGPVTFLMSHKIKDYGVLFKDDGYREIIPSILGLKAEYQFQKFREKCPDSDYIIFFDEPILSQIGSAVTNIDREEVKEIIGRAFSEVHCYKGIHICGNSDWDFILSLPLDIINFDTYNYGENFLLYRDAIGGFIARGGYIAAGMIPTDSDEIKAVDEAMLLTKTKNFIKELETIVSPELLSERLFITPSCGMGALTVHEAEKALNLLKNISDTLQEF